MKTATTGFVVLLLVTSAAAIGVSGAISDTTNENATQVSACRVIDSPGTYALTQDLMNKDVDTCIDIQSSDVTFDGNGHVIDGYQEKSFAADFGIGINVDSSTSNVTVRNVRSTEWRAGIDLEGTNNTVANVAVTDNTHGIDFYANDSTIRDSNISNNRRRSMDGSGFGVYTAAYSPNTPMVHGDTISNNTVRRNFIGLNLGGLADTKILNNRIGSNYAMQGFEEDGIQLGSASNVVLAGNHITNDTVEMIGQYRGGTTGLVYRDNVARNSTVEFVAINRLRVENNTFVGGDHPVLVRGSNGANITGNTIDAEKGFFIDNGETNSTDVTVTDNVVDTDDVGITVDGVAGTVVEDNHVTSGNDAMRVSGPNATVSDNEIDAVRGISLKYSADGVVSDNSIDASSSGISVGSAPNATVTNNDVRTGGSGIGIAISDGAVVSGNTLMGENGTVAGIGVKSANTTVTGNDVRDFDTGVLVTEYPAEIADNEITHTDVGVETSANKTAIAGNTVSDASDVGISLSGTADTAVIGNDVTDSGVGLRVANPNGEKHDIVARNTFESNGDGILVNRSTATLLIRKNTIRNNENGIHIERYVQHFQCKNDTVVPQADTLEVHRNTIADNSDYGVLNEDVATLDATNNYWGASDGPSSPATTAGPLEDPVTGTLADGSGDAVSQGDTPGVSNVHFDGWLGTSPTPAR